MADQRGAGKAADRDQQRRESVLLSELARRHRRRKLRPMAAQQEERLTGTERATYGARSQGEPMTNKELQQQQQATNSSSNSSEIDARLNRLRLHDELSQSGGRAHLAAGGGHSAAAAATMEQEHHQQITTGELSRAQAAACERVALDMMRDRQQQTQTHDLDSRLADGRGGDTASLVVATSGQTPAGATPAVALYSDLPQQQQQHQQIPLLVGTGGGGGGSGDQYPLQVLDDRLQYQQQQHHDYHLYQHQNHLQPVNVQHHQYSHQLSNYAHEAYEDPVVGGASGFLQEEGQMPLANSSSLLLDLDQQRQHQQQLVQARVSPVLPQSVIRVNNWEERKASANYHQQQHERYGGSSGSGGQLSRRTGSGGGGHLATLNSAASLSIEHGQSHLASGNNLTLLQHNHHHHHHHHRRHDSTSSFNLSTNSTSSLVGGGGGGERLGGGSYGTAHGHSSSGLLPMALAGAISHMAPADEALYGGGGKGVADEYEDEDDEDEAAVVAAAAVERARARRRPASGRGRRQPATTDTPTSGASSEPEDELKVCEWHNCGNTFLDMREFVRHLDERHVNQEPREKNRFFCLWANCKRNSQEFNARYKLLIHMRVHSGEKPFICDQAPHCKKSFSRLENLKIHKRSHTGEKPYRCNYAHCSKSFTNSSDRIKHHKTHKDPKPYNCTHDGCTKRYTDPSSLRKHLRAHKRHGGLMSDPLGEPHSSCVTAVAAAGPHPLYHHHHNQQQHQLQQPQHDSYQSERVVVIQPAAQSQQQQQRLNVEGQYAQAHNQYGAESYTSVDVKQQHVMYDQQQQQQQSQIFTQSYLPADYDPNKVLDSVLLGTSNASTITQQDEQLSASFKRPQQQQQQQQQQSHHESYDPQAQYHALPQRQAPASHGGFQPARSHDRRRQLQQARQHQQLSRSWCAGNSSSARSTATARPSRPESSVGRGVGPEVLRHQPISGGGAHQLAPPSQPGEWSQYQQQSMSDYDQSFVHSSRSNTYQVPQLQQQQQPPVMGMSQTFVQHQAQHQDQVWPSNSTQDQQQAPSRRVQFQAQQQQQQQHQYNHQQQQQPQQHNQQQQRQLTRQQHEQLMRSMPANVNL